MPVASGCAAYVILYVAYYPPIFATPDEMEYLTTANAVRNGTILDRECEDVYFPRRAPGEIRCFKGRSLFFSAIVACLLPIHWKCAFLPGLASHLATFVLVALAFSKVGRSAWWAWLVLLHPTLVLYSRFIMADMPSGAMAALVLVLLVSERRRPAIIGAVAGVSMFLRFTNCWLGLAVCIQLLRDDLTREGKCGIAARLWRGDTAKFLLPYACFCVAMLAGNALLYGGPFHTRYSSACVSLTNQDFVRHLPMYLLALNVVWPIMLLGVWFLPQRVWLFGATLVIIQLAFFSGLQFFLWGAFLADTIVRSLRYLIGSVVILCFGYPGLIERLLGRRTIPKPVVAAILTMGIGATLVLLHKHSTYLVRQARLVAAVYAAVPEGATVYFGRNSAELFCPVFGKRRTKPATRSFFDQRYEDVRAGDHFVFHIQHHPGQQDLAELAEKMIADLKAVAHLRVVEVPEETRALRIFQVVGRRPGVHLRPMTDSEKRQVFSPRP